MSNTESVLPMPNTERGTVSDFYNPRDQNAAFAVSGNSITWNPLSTAVAQITLTGNNKFETPINIEQCAGQMFTLDIIQDSTGGRKPSWGLAFDWVDAEPVLAQGPTTRTILQFYCTGQHMLGSVYYKTPENDNPSTI